MSEPTITLYGTRLSGHSHRVELMLSILGLPYRFVDAPAEVRRSAGFRALNPLGQIPVLDDGGVVLCDSNAILVYLARRYAPGSLWLPDDPVVASQVQRWLSIAAGEIRFGPGTARVIRLWGAPGDDVGPAIRIADRLMPFMEQHLSGRRYLAAAHPTLADLACYSYIAHAPEGGIALTPYPNIRAWLAQVEALPGFVAMPVSAS
ncbi:MAG: glutathione S-transferase [Burkholderiales bacterium]|nr:glutathione S-transferase [Burkholderiales bacterium]